MRQTKCSSCSEELPVRSCYLVNNQLYCEGCANKVVEQLQAINAPLSCSHAVDPTICYVCNADGGNSEFQTIKKTPCCPTCYEKAYNWPFPGWLKASMAFLLLVLVFALIRNVPYFRAGRALYKGERLVASGNYADAIPFLRISVKTAPDCDKCSLLLGKALFKIGDAPEAIKVLQAHNGGRYNDALEILNEVNEITRRANSAFEKGQEADKAYEAKDKERAVQLLNEAAAIYPEYQGFSVGATEVEIDIAYDRKDYDRFVALSKTQSERSPKEPIALGQYASALACKYATTGDERFRRQSEQVLENARALAVTPEQKTSFAEYDERIRHRLQSRLIIDKEEYDRRFRQQTTKEGAQ